MRDEIAKRRYETWEYMDLRYLNLIGVAEIKYILARESLKKKENLRFVVTGCTFVKRLQIVSTTTTLIQIIR